MHCKECGEDVEVDPFKGENGLMCPECRTVDELEDIEEPDLDPYPNRLWPEVEMN